MKLTGHKIKITYTMEEEKTLTFYPPKSTLLLVKNILLDIAMAIVFLGGALSTTIPNAVEIIIASAIVLFFVWNTYDEWRNGRQYDKARAIIKYGINDDATNIDVELKDKQ